MGDFATQKLGNTSSKIRGAQDYAVHLPGIQIFYQRGR